MSGPVDNPKVGGVKPSPGAAARSRRPQVRDLVDQSTLPAVVRDIIVTVVGRTRLRRSERFEIARELIAHFEDGLAAGREPGELIASFGDPRQAAVLIRRARKRQRPLIWWAWRRAWQGAAALFGLVLLLLTWSYIRMVSVSPTISRDYLAEMNARAIAVPQDERAWPLVREAMLAINADRTSQHQFAGARSGEEGWDALRPILESHVKALDLLRSVKDTPGLGYVAGHWIAAEDWPVFHPDVPYDPPPAPVQPGETAAIGTGLIGVLLPQLSVLRQASVWLKSDLWLALETGDGERAAANLQAMLTLAKHTDETPMLINQLVKIAILHMALTEIVLALDEHAQTLTDAHLERLAHRLASFGGGSLTIDFAGERALFYDLLQRIYSDDGQGDGRLTADGIRFFAGIDDASSSARMPLIQQPLLPLYGLLAPSRRDLADAYESIIGEAERESRIPLWERGPSRVPAAVERLQQSPLDGLRYMLVILLAPVLERSTISVENTAMACDAVLTLIALERWRRDHGGVHPERLEQLVPEYLAALPTDRFTGEPLRYRLVNGSPLFYSVGVNRVDDGGRRYTFHAERMPLAFTEWKSREELAELKRRSDSGDRSTNVDPAIFDTDVVFWPLKD